MRLRPFVTAAFLLASLSGAAAQRAVADPPADDLRHGTLVETRAGDIYAAAELQAIAPGPHGTVLVSEGHNGRIAMFTPSGTMTEIRLPAGTSADVMLTAPDGTIWYADELGDVLGRISPSGNARTYRVAHNAHVRAMTIGGEGALWFAMSGLGAIGRVDRSGGMRRVGTWPAGFQPEGIVTARDGNVWVADAGGGALVRISPGGAVRRFPLRVRPRDLVIGVDGNMWFDEIGQDAIGRMTPGGTFKQFALNSPGGHDPKFNPKPFHIAAAPDGLWIVEESNDVVLHLAPNGTQSVLPATFEGRPWDITRAPDGRVWFTENGANDVAIVKRDRSIRHVSLALPAGAADAFVPVMLAAAPGNAFWLLDTERRSVGLLRGDKTFEERHRWPAGEDLWDLCAGPTGDAWLIDRTRGALARVGLDGSFTELPLSLGEAPGPLAVTRDGAMWVGARRNGQLVRFLSDGRRDESLPIARGATIARILPGRESELLMLVCASTRCLLASSTGATISAPMTLHTSMGSADFMLADDRALWFSEETRAGSGFFPGLTRRAANGSRRHLTVPWMSTGFGGGLAAGSGGEIWFALDAGAQDHASVGRANAAGNVRRFALPSQSRVATLAAGSDAMWFLPERDRRVRAPTIGSIGRDGSVHEYRIATTRAPTAFGAREAASALYRPFTTTAPGVLIAGRAP